VVNIVTVIAATLYGKKILMIDLKDSPFYPKHERRKHFTVGK
jgi:hypothetical protein